MALSDIAHSVGASQSTVRRDLDLLQSHGLVRRTRGGALLLDPGQSAAGAASDPDVAAAHKQAIARAVAQLIPPGQTVMLNGGSTCFQVAAALQGRRLSVVTNSVAIASLLCSDLATEVTVLGGYVYPRIGVTVGDSAGRQLESLHASRLVTSCAALTADGVFEPNQMMVDVERRMMQSAGEVILAADHTKLGLRSVVKLCELEELDVIVTDADADESARGWLSRLNAKVIYAET